MKTTDGNIRMYNSYMTAFKMDLEGYSRFDIAKYLMSCGMSVVAAQSYLHALYSQKDFKCRLLRHFFTCFYRLGKIT